MHEVVTGRFGRPFVKAFLVGREMKVGLLAVSLAAGIVGIYACTSDNKANQEISGPDYLTSRSEKLMGEELVLAIRSGRERSKPFIQLHRDAVTDVRLNYEAYLSGNGSLNERVCRTASVIAQKYSARAAQMKPGVFSKADITNLATSGVNAVPNCKTSVTASMFGYAALIRSESTTDGPFGETFDLYYNVVRTTIENWDGETNLEEDVDDAINSMAMQYPLYMEESEMLGAMVELAHSSFEDAMLNPYPDAWNDAYPVGSMFNTSAIWSWRTFLIKVVIVTLVDVAGFYGAAIPYALVNRNDEDYEASHAVLAGAAVAGVGSAAMAVNCITNNPPCKTNP